MSAPNVRSTSIFTEIPLYASSGDVHAGRRPSSRVVRDPQRLELRRRAVVVPDEAQRRVAEGRPGRGGVHARRDPGPARRTCRGHAASGSRRCGGLLSDSQRAWSVPLLPRPWRMPDRQQGVVPLHQAVDPAVELERGARPAGRTGPPRTSGRAGPASRPDGARRRTGRCGPRPGPARRSRTRPTRTRSPTAGPGCPRRTNRCVRRNACRRLASVMDQTSDDAGRAAAGLETSPRLDPARPGVEADRQQEDDAERDLLVERIEAEQVEPVGDRGRRTGSRGRSGRWCPRHRGCSSRRR